jgi:hypothetical protein
MKKRRARRKNQKNLRALRFFMVDFHSCRDIVRDDLNDSCGNPHGGPCASNSRGAGQAIVRP